MCCKLPELPTILCNLLVIITYCNKFLFKKKLIVSSSLQFVIETNIVFRKKKQPQHIEKDCVFFWT